MNLLSQEQIYDISMKQSLAVCPISFAKGMEEAQKLLLESASEGFKEWVYKYPDKCDLRDFEKPNHNYFVAEEAWQACSLSHAKKMQEKDKEIERLKGALESINENLMLMLASYGDNARIEKLIKDSLNLIKGEAK